MVDINSLVLPGSDIEVVDAFFITERSEIAGIGILPNGDAHAVLLIPASLDEIAASDAPHSSKPAHTVHPFIKNAANSAFNGHNRALEVSRQKLQRPQSLAPIR
jgi:hypothetical protein